MEKKGKGKRAGAVSFTEVSLAELMRVFTPEARIPVARLFAETMHLENRPIAAADRAERIAKLSVPPVKVTPVNLDHES